MDSTPIASLPDMGNNSGGNSAGGHLHASQTSTYTPLNAHKNPYMDTPPGFMPPPAHVGAGRSNDMRNIPNIDDMQQYTLPSRDIPRNTDVLTQDEQTIPSYIPRHTQENMDYITSSSMLQKEFEGEKKKNKNKKQVHFAEDSLNELQQPFILALVFFIFHLPIITNLFCKYLGSFGFAGIDGNINVAGIMLKSILFGIIVYTYKYIMADYSDY